MRRTPLRFIPAILAALTFVQSFLAQEDTPDAFAKTESWSLTEMENARSELAAIRKRITEENRPLLEQLGELQASVSELKRQRTELNSSTSSAKTKAARLEAELKEKRARHSGALNRLISLRSAFEENLHEAERDQYRAQLLAFEKIEPTSEQAAKRQLESALSTADIALQRSQNQLGGHRFEASAWSDSLAREGSVLQLGPYAFIDFGDGSVAEVSGSKDLRPTAQTRSTIRANELKTQKSPTLPIDPTLGQAALVEASRVTWWQHLRSGGIWMIPISLFGILSTAFGLFKLLQIRQIQAPRSAVITELSLAQTPENFEQAAQALPSASRDIFAQGFALRAASERKRHAAMTHAFISFRGRLESKLSLIALTAAVAPLLGLLGTVTGMIKTFQLISINGAGDARILSGGISEALVTTEFGLVVAIPALLLHAWLTRRSRRISLETSALADQYNKSFEPEVKS